MAARASSGGGTWGTDISAADSPIAVAAVHSGRVAVDKHGLLDIRVRPG